MDKILGLEAPEPLARLVRPVEIASLIPRTHFAQSLQYSPSYYRATWIVTGLDAGFATAMAIRPKWLRDIASLVFSVYYMIYAQEADEKVRRTSLIFAHWLSAPLATTLQGCAYN